MRRSIGDIGHGLYEAAVGIRDVFRPGFGWVPVGLRGVAAENFGAALASGTRVGLICVDGGGAEVVADYTVRHPGVYR